MMLRRHGCLVVEMTDRPCDPAPIESRRVTRSSLRPLMWQALALATLSTSCASLVARPPAPAAEGHLTHGVAVGEVAATTAVVWARCDRVTTLHATIDGAPPQRDANVAA